MISVFIICIGPLHKRQMTIKPWKLPKNVALGVGSASPRKMLEFYSWKCYVFVHFISIRCNHYLWQFAHWGHALLPP